MIKKEDVLNTISQIITSLGTGKMSSLDILLDQLKLETASLEILQEPVLDFIQQVEFQKDYDPQHLITPNIQKSADKLIKILKKAL